MFKSVVKDRLFYDQFEFVVKFHLDEVSCLRTLDHGSIDRTIERRRAWRMASLTISNGITPVTVPISESTVTNLHIMADRLMAAAAASTNFKLCVSAFTAFVYTNDLALIWQLAQLPGVEQVEYSRAVIGRPKNTIQLKDPKHQLRSFFKNSKLTNEQKNQLTSFLTNQPDIRLSPGLKQWLGTKFTRTQDYHFVDYNESLWLTMLGLVQPGLVRKTVQIIAAK